MDLVEMLAGEIGPRPAGSAAAARAAAAVADAFRDVGVEVRFQEFPFVAYEPDDPLLEIDGDRWEAAPVMYGRDADVEGLFAGSARTWCSRDCSSLPHSPSSWADGRLHASTAIPLAAGRRPFLPGTARRSPDRASSSRRPTRRDYPRAHGPCCAAAVASSRQPNGTCWPRSPATRTRRSSPARTTTRPGTPAERLTTRAASRSFAACSSASGAAATVAACLRSRSALRSSGSPAPATSSPKRRRGTAGTERLAAEGSQLQIVRHAGEVGESGRAPLTLDAGDVFIYLYQGRLEIVVDDGVFELGPGDALHCDRPKTITWRSSGEERAVAIWASGAYPRSR